MVSSGSYHTPNTTVGTLGVCTPEDAPSPPPPPPPPPPSSPPLLPLQQHLVAPHSPHNICSCHKHNLQAIWVHPLSHKCIHPHLCLHHPHPWHMHCAAPPAADGQCAAADSRPAFLQVLPPHHTHQQQQQQQQQLLPPPPPTHTRINNMPLTRPLTQQAAAVTTKKLRLMQQSAAHTLPAELTPHTSHSSHATPRMSYLPPCPHCKQQLPSHLWLFNQNWQLPLNMNLCIPWESPRLFNTVDRQPTSLQLNPCAAHTHQAPPLSKQGPLL